MGTEDDDGAGGSACELERYEQLRARALAGASDGFQMRLALCQRRGVAAWRRAWQGSPPAAALATERRSIELPGEAGQIVDVLAAMALACAGAG